MSEQNSIEDLFRGRHFDRNVIILCVRWYLRYKRLMSTDTTAAEKILTDFAGVGVHVETLGRELQDAGASSFQKSWDELMEVLMSKHAELTHSR